MGLATTDGVPEVVSFEAQPTSVAPGGTIAASALAVSSGPGPVTYTWAVEPEGWTVAPSGGAATVRAPLAYDAVGILTVAASDGFGTVTATRLLATSAYARPRIASLVAVPAPVPPGGAAQVVVAAESGAGLPLAYRWSVLGSGWAIRGDGPAAVLTAPPARAQPAIATVTVTDAAGATATGTGTVTVTVTTAP